jgi:hypothetical protein
MGARRLRLTHSVKLSLVDQLYLSPFTDLGLLGFQGVKLRGIFRKALFCAFLGVVPYTQAKTITPEEWASTLLRSEIDILNQNFAELAKTGSVPATTLTQTQKLTQSIKTELASSPSEAAVHAASLKYITLTNYLTINQMEGLNRDEKPIEELSQAKLKAEALISKLPLSGGFADPAEAAFLGELKQVEDKAEIAKGKILSIKRRLSMKATLIRLQILRKLDPASGSAFSLAIKGLSNALKNFEQHSELQTEEQTIEALSHALGLRAENWDGRHLWSYLQLKILAKSLALTAGVSEDAKHALAEKLEALETAKNEQEFASAANGIQGVASTVIQSPEFDSNDPVFILSNSPEEAVRITRLRLEGVRRWMPEVRDSYLKNETTLQSWETAYRLKVMGILAKMDRDLASAATLLRETNDMAVIEQFFRSAPFLQTLTSTIANAALDHSDAVENYHQIWKRGLSRILAGSRFMNTEETAKLNAALRIERQEGVRQAWVNRHNASVLATSALLIAALPITGGGSAAAMPAALSLVGSIGVAGAKAVLIADSALNIADRTKIQGVKGLANIDTAFDVFMILSLTPRPMIGSAAAPTFLGRMSQAGLRSVAELQYSTAAFLAVAAPSYGAYLIWNAESISASMREEGVIVSASDVRRKGLVNIAKGILAMGVNSAYYRQGVAQNGKAFEEQIQRATFTQGSLPSFVQRFRQIKALQDMYKSNPTWVGALKTTATGAGFLAMDYLLVTEALLLSYANLDSNFIAHAEEVHPMPDLKDGETAVVLIGFEQSDYFLYAGAQSKFTNRHEIRKYGKRLFIYDYESPEDLVAVLQKHTKKHGPVRYLKIATHGRPGRLFTPEVSTSPEGALTGGWIDQEWLTQNEAPLKKKARSIFARDARVRLWSCLVGANLDSDAGEGTRVGEDFVNKLGNVLLVKGGSIDASTRVLMGLDATLGTLGDHSVRESFRDVASARPSLALPVSSLVDEDSGEETWEAGEDPANWNHKMASTLEMGETMARRLVGIFSHWPPVWWSYGVNLEGPFWQSRYLSVDFAEQP